MFFETVYKPTGYALLAGIVLALISQLLGLNVLALILVLFSTVMLVLTIAMTRKREKAFAELPEFTRNKRKGSNVAPEHDLDEDEEIEQEQKMYQKVKEDIGDEPKLEDIYLTKKGFLLSLKEKFAKPFSGKTVPVENDPSHANSVSETKSLATQPSPSGSLSQFSMGKSLPSPPVLKRYADSVEVPSLTDVEDNEDDIWIPGMVKKTPNKGVLKQKFPSSHKKVQSSKSEPDTGLGETFEDQKHQPSITTVSGDNSMSFFKPKDSEDIEIPYGEDKTSVRDDEIVMPDWLAELQNQQPSTTVEVIGVEGYEADDVSGESGKFFNSVEKDVDSSTENIDGSGEEVGKFTEEVEIPTDSVTESSLNHFFAQPSQSNTSEAEITIPDEAMSPKLNELLEEMLNEDVGEGFTVPFTEVEEGENGVVEIFDTTTFTPTANGAEGKDNNEVENVNQDKQAERLNSDFTSRMGAVEDSEKTEGEYENEILQIKVEENVSGEKVGQNMETGTEMGVTNNSDVLDKNGEDFSHQLETHVTDMDEVGKEVSLVETTDGTPVVVTQPEVAAIANHINDLLQQTESKAQQIIKNKLAEAEKIAEIKRQELEKQWQEVLESVKREALEERKMLEAKFEEEKNVILAEKETALEEVEIAKSDRERFATQNRNLIDSLDEAEESLNKVIEAQRSVAEAATKSVKLNAVSKIRKVRKEAEGKSSEEILSMLDASIDDFRKNMP